MVFRRIVGMIVVVLVGIALSTPGMAASGKKKSASTGNTSRSVRDASAALPPVYVNPMYPGYGENFNPHRP